MRFSTLDMVLGADHMTVQLLAQRNGADGLSFLWETEGGIKLVTLVVGVGLLIFFGVIAWIVRNWKLAKLNDEYLRATRSKGEHSAASLLRAVKQKPLSEKESYSKEEQVLVAELVSATPRFSTPEPAAPISKGDWLLSRGMERLERELADGRRRRKTCQACRYVSAGGLTSCPYAFSCGVLHHPRGNLGYAVWKASLWFGFAVVLIAILLGIFAVLPMKNQQRTIGEAFSVIWPGLLGMALLAGGISFFWHCWGSFKIRRQVRQAAQAAESLGLEFFNFQPLSLETGSLVFPLAIPGELKDVHAVMRGKLQGDEVFVGYYEYEWSERYARSETDRRMAVARAAIGKEIHITWGQLVMMFPEPLQGVPDFQLSPRKDIDYHILREAGAVPLRGRLAEKVEAIYCVTSRQIAGYLFDEQFQQFMLDNSGWNLQLLRGRLMLWHDRLDELSAEIVPGNATRLVSDLDVATKWRQLLTAKGRVDNIARSFAEYQAATPPKREIVDERTAVRRKYAAELRENIKPWQALALAIFFTCMGTGFAIAGFFDPNLEEALRIWLPLGLIPVVLLLMGIFIITIRD